MDSYVTIRKNRTITSPNSSFISTHSDYLSRSLPDLSSGHINEVMEELKEEIENLKKLLQAANNEIDSLILENNSLKKKTRKRATYFKLQKNMFRGW